MAKMSVTVAPIPGGRLLGHRIQKLVRQYDQSRVFLVLIFLLFRHKILEFRINCFKFTQYFAKISRLIFIIIRESFVIYASK